VTLGLVLSSLSALVTTLRADEQADHAALRSLVQEYEATIQKADPSLLKAYLADDFSGVMVTGEEVNSYESLDAYWNKIQSLLGKGGKYSVKINVAGPATIVGDIAYAHGTTEDTAVTGAGKEFKFQGFWTAICKRSGNGWKISRIHGSMDAITNAFVQPLIKASALTGGTIGGVVGLVVGAALAWLWRRRGGQPAVA
jgi:ketosteroid isomerase-like protein